MKLGDHVRPELVTTDLRGRTVEEVLTELATLPAATGQVADVDALVASLARRERMHRTALGSGVAVPHALCAELAAPIVVVGISGQGAPFGTGEEGEAVHVFFMVLSPPERSSAHIKLLARIARLSRHADFLSSLRASGSGDEAVETIRDFESRHV